MITTEQKLWTEKGGWQSVGINTLRGNATLVLVFGGSRLVHQPRVYEEIHTMYPHARIIAGSTAGEIMGTQVFDNTIVLTATAWEHTTFECHVVPMHNADESKIVGKSLAAALRPENLVHVMVFSDGLHINGTELVRGLAQGLPKNVAITGGLVGDGADFAHTFVGLDAPAAEKQAVVVGFYSRVLHVGYGSVGGWDPFGPERIITRSKGNVLYELDGTSALDLYKEYLGDRAKDLPSSALLFPLTLRVQSDTGEAVEVVRTVLGVDEKDQSMTFAGDMPLGVPAKLMKANFDHLVEGASKAAGMSLMSIREHPEVAILISCIGRKLVLKERTEEELEAVQEMLGAQAAMVGFYSYGEISPTTPTEKQCQLHNQTMTITIFKEP